MGVNLPSTLPTGSSGGSLKPNVGKAGNFDTMKLNQQKERDAASTSISRPGGKRRAASTSISHPGGARQGASTSVSHPGQAIGAAGGDDWDQEGADRRRAAHIRKLIKEKQKKEAAEVRAASSKGAGIKKGSAFKKTGTGGLHKTMRKLVKKGGKGLTKTEKKLLENVVASGAKKKKVGSDFTAKDKRAMVQKVYKEKKSGKLSQGFGEIKKIIGGLE